MRHPDMLDRLAILNGPHPLKLIRALRTPAQLAKSWYMFFFQIPALPEAIMRLDNYKISSARSAKTRRGSHGTSNRTRAPAR